MSIKKQYVTPDELRIDSFLLAMSVIDDGFAPDLLVVLARGGLSIGVYVHELLKRKNIISKYIPICTSRYTQVDTASDTVLVEGLELLLEKLESTSKVLIVDDIFDSGLSIKAVIEELQKRCGDNMPNIIRIATIYFKPERNVTDIAPNYFVKTTNKWIVFPHEISEVNDNELESFFGPEIANIIRN